MKLTWWEFRAYIVLWVAKLLRIRIRDLHDSYPYNPFVKKEVTERQWRLWTAAKGLREVQRDIDDFLERGKPK